MSMKARQSNRVSWSTIAAITLLLESGSATAANPALQDLFFAACENPLGALAERCAETQFAAGNLSTDSESSLNPSQALAGTSLANREVLARERGGPANAASAPAARLELGRFSLVASASRGWEDRNRPTDPERERSYEADSTAAELGADYRLNDRAVIGAIAVWQRRELDFDAAPLGVNFTPAPTAGTVDSDSLGLVAFLALSGESGGYLDLSVGYESGERDQTRYSVFQESTRVVPQTLSVVTASTDTQSLWAGADAGWLISRGAWEFGVNGGLTFMDSEADSFEERDRSTAGLAMRYSSSSQQTLVAAFGGSAARAIATDFGVLLPYARVTLYNSLDDERVELRTSYLLDAGENTLDLAGETPDDLFVVASVGISTVLPHGLTPYLDVSYWAGYDDIDRLSVVIGLRREL